MNWQARLSRRSALKLGALGAAGSLVMPSTASAAKAAAGKVSVSVWYPFGGHEDTAFRASLAGFEQAYPEIHLDLLSVGYSNVAPKVSTATAAGTPPDVAVLTGNFDLGTRIVTGAIEPLDPYLKTASGKALLADLWPSMVQSVSYEGKVYALPNDMDDGCGFLYNMELFKQKGLDPTKPPTNLDDLARMAKEFVRYQAPGRLASFGFIPWFNADLLTWGPVFGGTFYDAQNHKITANHPGNVAALEWLVTYAQSYKLDDVNNFMAGFGQAWTAGDPFVVGRLAMEINGEWTTWTMKTYASKLAYGVTYPPAPPGGRHHVVLNGGNVAFIPKGAKHPQEAWLVLDWITRPKALYILNRGIYNIPPTRSVCEAALHNDFSAGNPGILKFIKLQVAPDADRIYFPVTGVEGQYADALSTAMMAAIAGKKKPKQALDEVTASLQHDLDALLAHAR
jgi:multiple sugar transport system substrate-binding protein